MVSCEDFLWEINPLTLDAGCPGDRSRWRSAPMKIDRSGFCFENTRVVKTRGYHIYIYIYIYGVYGYKYGYKYIKHGNIYIYIHIYMEYTVYPIFIWSIPHGLAFFFGNISNVASFNMGWWTCSSADLESWIVIPGMVEQLPSGKHTKNYWKWPFIVDLPIKNGDFP